MARKGEELQRDDGEVEKCAGEHIEGRFEGGEVHLNPPIRGGGIG